MRYQTIHSAENNLNLWEPNEEIWRTNVTDEDKEQAIKDSYGVSYSPDGMRLIEVKRNLTTYKIKEGTRVICDEAFWGCGSLTTLHLPDSLTTIGNWAFCSCGSLATLHLPDSLTTIGNRAFNKCNSLTALLLPACVTAIGSNPFVGCI